MDLIFEEMFQKKNHFYWILNNQNNENFKYHKCFIDFLIFNLRFIYIIFKNSIE